DDLDLPRAAWLGSGRRGFRVARDLESAAAGAQRQPAGARALLSRRCVVPGLSARRPPVRSGDRYRLSAQPDWRPAYKLRRAPRAPTDAGRDLPALRLSAA